MMRAVVERVDARAAVREHPRDSIVRSTNERFVEQPSGHAGLIRRDDNCKPRTIQQPDGVHAVRKEPDPLELIQVSRFLDERAVAIQEHGALHPAASLTGRRRITASNTASTVIFFMQR